MGARFVWINALVGGVFAVAVDAKQRLIGQHLADLGVDLGNIRYAFKCGNTGFIPAFPS